MMANPLCTSAPEPVADNTLAELNWKNFFLLETPGDDEVGGLPRQVPSHVGHVYILRVFQILNSDYGRMKLETFEVTTS